MTLRLGITLLVFLLIRLALMFFVPVLGDEAYYFYWGMHPAAGYYDLPPMIGWWLIPFAELSLLPLWLRLPNLISLVLVSWSIYEWLSQGMIKSRAFLVAACFFLLPLPFLAVIMFPDIPLLFFSYFSAYLFFRGVTVRKGKEISFLFSGALMGAGVLSKYFAAFLLPAYLIWFFITPHRKPIHLMWFVLGGIPFALQHLLWNQTHCWSNIVFNFVTRQNVADGPFYQVIGFFILFLVVASAPFWKSIFSHGFENAQWNQSLSRFTALLWGSAVFIFALTALRGRGQGLHWLLFILPFFTIWIGLRCDEIRLRGYIKTLTFLTGALSIIALIVFIMPQKTLASFFQQRFQFEFAQLTHRENFIETILPEVTSADAVFTEGYTLSSILNYDIQSYARNHQITLPEVYVWGSGSRFGRTFDWTTDFIALDGKKFVIITPGAFNTSGWSPYFQSLKTETKIFEGRGFSVSTGEGFRAQAYLKTEFKKPIETYYVQTGARCVLWDMTH